MNYTLYYQGQPRISGDLIFLNDVISRAVFHGATRSDFEMRIAHPGEQVTLIDLPRTYEKSITR